MKIVVKAHHGYRKTGGQLSPVNLKYISEWQTSYEIRFDVLPFEGVDEVELDEMWSFVFSKANQRWLWLAPGHQTGAIFIQSIMS